MSGKMTTTKTMEPDNTGAALAVVSDEGFDLTVDVQRVLNQTLAMQRLMAAVMREGVHYGVVPGTEKLGPDGKPKLDKDGRPEQRMTLYQPGSDKLCLLFRLRPEYDITATKRRDYIGYQVRCRLFHIHTGLLWGEGMGSANSRESKYLNQSTAKLCPKCGKAGTIMKSRPERGDGWYCWAQKGGCGEQFPKNDPGIQEGGTTVVGDKVYNLDNTILKIACKRAKAAAVLTATAASDLFTQDLLEDLEEQRLDAQAQQEGGPGPGDQKPNGNGASANGTAPATNGNGNGNGAATGPRKCNPGQIRDLNMSLREKGIGPDRSLEWARANLPPERAAAITQLMDLQETEADGLLKKSQTATPPVAGGR